MKVAEIGILIPIWKPDKNFTLPSKLSTENAITPYLENHCRDNLDLTFQSNNETKTQGQNTYHPGKGTSVQVLAVKMLYVKAQVTDDLPGHTKLIDISKASDNVCRHSLEEM